MVSSKQSSVTCKHAIYEALPKAKQHFSYAHDTGLYTSTANSNYSENYSILALVRVREFSFVPMYHHCYNIISELQNPSHCIGSTTYLAQEYNLRSGFWPSFRP
jgi:hypothetical protein